MENGRKWQFSKTNIFNGQIYQTVSRSNANYPLQYQSKLPDIHHIHPRSLKIESNQGQTDVINRKRNALSQYKYVHPSHYANLSMPKKQKNLQRKTSLNKKSFKLKQPKIKIMDLGLQKKYSSPEGLPRTLSICPQRWKIVETLIQGDIMIRQIGEKTLMPYKLIVYLFQQIQATQRKKRAIEQNKKIDKNKHLMMIRKIMQRTNYRLFL